MELGSRYLPLCMVLSIGWFWSQDCARTLTDQELWQVRGAGNGMCVAGAEICEGTSVTCASYGISACVFDAVMEYEYLSGTPAGNWYECDGGAPPQSTCDAPQQYAQTCLKTWNCYWDDELECVRDELTLDQENRWKGIHITGNPCG
jgi:hypothetical protein